MSSRVKKCLEPTVEKYMLFLTGIKNSAGYEAYSLREFISDFKINKTIKKALIDLAIIDYEADNKWTWLQDEPDRKLSLTVLNYLLERSKKSRSTVIAGLEETNAVLRSLSEKVTEYIQRRENGFKQPQTHVTNGNSSQIHSKNDYYSLFSEVDTKNDLINKAAFAIAPGVYNQCNGCSESECLMANKRIVFAAKDLVNQLLK